MVICILSAYVRLANLGEPGFWTDEIYHVYAAKGMLDGRGPHFESGDEYSRAIEYTTLVAAAFATVGESEFSARLPSVLVSILFLIVSTVWVAREFDVLTAAIYALCLGLAPIEVEWGRLARMYSLFQAFFFATAVMLYYAIERKPASTAPTGTIGRFTKLSGINPGFLFAGLVLLYLSNRLHDLTATIAVAIACYVFLCALMSVLRLLPKSSVWGGRYTIFLGTILLSVLIVSQVAPELVGNKLSSLSQPLSWGVYDIEGPSYYRYLFEENYPWLFFAGPIGLVLIYFEKPRLAIFLFSMSVAILLFLSLFSVQKNDRYVYHVFPFLVIPSSFILSIVLKKIWQAAEQQAHIPSIFARVAASVGLLVLLYGACSPWISESRRLADSWQFADWKKLVKAHPELADSKNTILATDQNLATYYLGRKPDYYIRAEYDSESGDAEYFQHVSVLRSESELRQVIDSSSNVFLISTSQRLKNRVFFDSDMEALLNKEFRKIDVAPGSRLTVLMPRYQLDRSE